MSVVPVATYRFQLTPSFGFDQVVERIDHVRRLGASHVYLSPIAEAVTGSSHGYDVVDHTRVRAEFGGAEGFERVLDAVANREMAVLIDHVPNHVASTRPELNPRWWELLRDGRSSPADDWFDVDWEVADERVILPLLGAPLDEVLAEGHVAIDDGDLVVYGERRLPIRSGTADAGDIAAVLDAQHYRLQYWRESARNVRRFFTIDDLVAVRVEHEHVATEVDSLPARYTGHAGFGGVRVDHVDGLADPLRYLNGLRGRIGDDALLYVEKIVAPGEWLPEVWPVDGTTGYESIRAIDHLLLNADAEVACTRRWSADAGDVRSFESYESDAKREVVAEALAPDLERLTRVALDAVGGDADEVAAEVHQLTVDLHRYRTYLPDDSAAAALIGAISDGPVADAIVRGANPSELALRTRWQQLTGPVMAKGAEDRAFYRYLRLASSCEVGGDPGSFGTTIDSFHDENVERHERWPRAMLAGSTHDTKRSEDIRARSAATTWMIEAWEPIWADQVTAVADATGIDPAAASLAVQTVATTPGLDADRLTEFLVKAAREAAVHTGWETTDDGYEDRLRSAASWLLAHPLSEAFVRELDQVAASLSLEAVTLRLLSPGVPDIYQGTEAFSFRLVDPDNRVPPDWDALERAASDERPVAELWAEDDPTVKTGLVRSLLDVRRRHPDAFAADAPYSALDAGPGAVAFARGGATVVAVRRGLAPVTGTLAFPPGRWYDVLDPGAPTLSGDVAVESVIGGGPATFPIAVFERDD